MQEAVQKTVQETVRQGELLKNPSRGSEARQGEALVRHRFAVEYLGSAFAGWQIQEGVATVQGSLEHALQVVFKSDYRVTGSGRTDSGVHARGQVAHVDLPVGTDARKLTRSLNALCGPHLAVRSLEACADTFHARYSAQSRHYTYRIITRPSPLLAGQTWFIPTRLDFAKLATELPAALGEHDFVRFCIPRHDGKSTHCLVHAFEAIPGDGHITVNISANRFLHRMVRSLVGAAVDVGRGWADAGLIARVLCNPNETPPHWTWAPAQGLCLEKVTYADYDP